MARLLSRIKQRLVPAGGRPRVVRSGVFRGLRLVIDLSYQSQLYLGLFERETHRWLRRLSRGISSAVDVGAADGEYTLYFLARTGAARCLAIEPSTDCLPRLRANLGLNGRWPEPRLELLALFVGDGSAGRYSLDALARLLSGPCLIKVDVDGGELEILRGAPELLALPDARWLIETHSPELEAACIAHLRRFGYATRIVRNAWWRAIIPEMRPSKHNRWLVARRAA